MSLMMCIAIVAETFVKNTLSMGVVCMVNSTANAMHHQDNPDFAPRSNQTDCQVTNKIDKQYDVNLSNYSTPAQHVSLKISLRLGSIVMGLSDTVLFNDGHLFGRTGVWFTSRMDGRQIQSQDNYIRMLNFKPRRHRVHPVGH